MKTCVLFFAVLLASTAAACHKELNAGRCNTNDDCATGQRCDLAMNGMCEYVGLRQRGRRHQPDVWLHVMRECESDVRGAVR